MTLAEIESAVESRQHWLDRLAQLRQQTSGIVMPSANLQSILDDIREDRPTEAA